VPFKTTFFIEKTKNVESIGNELLQIISLFNCIQPILIFASLTNFAKRFTRVNKSDECFYLRGVFRKRGVGVRGADCGVQGQQKPKIFFKNNNDNKTTKIKRKNKRK